MLDGVSLTRPTCPQLRSATSRMWKILSLQVIDVNPGSSIVDQGSEAPLLPGPLR